MGTVSSGSGLGLSIVSEIARRNGGRVLLETHCLQWPASLGEEGGYGKIIRVELLHKLHDELHYDGLDALKAGIARDCDAARAFFASTHAETRRQTTRDRI